MSILSDLVPLASIDPSAVEHLLDLAFGADRHQRTAYSLRRGMAPITELSFAALSDGELVGSIQCWPVELRTADGTCVPMVLMGPVAVHPDRQRQGIGRRLVAATLAKADASDSEPMVLIGDAVYYDRFFGFKASHTALWQLPGPVERDRLLARVQPGQALPRRAILGPRTCAVAEQAPSLVVPTSN